MQQLLLFPNDNFIVSYIISTMFNLNVYFFQLFAIMNMSFNNIV